MLLTGAVCGISEADESYFWDRFFWLALYAQPALWVGLAIFALVRFENAIWLALIGQYHSSAFLPAILLITQDYQ